MVNDTRHSTNGTSAQIADKTFIEYFAGIGLVRLGLESAGWSVIFGNDFAPEKYAMYKAAFPDTAQYYHVANVFDLDPAIVPTATLATCSFPCIDLSLAGNKNGLEGKHSSAFWGVINILRAQLNEGRCPAFILLENVGGWLTSNYGADFRVTITALNELGYSCDVFTLDALRFTPQSRPRVFVIGSRLHKSSNSLEPLFKRPASLATSRLKKSVSANADLRWMWLNIPNPPPLRTEGLGNALEAMDDNDSRWWSQEEMERHLAMMVRSHKARVEALAVNDFLSYRTVYRRMRHGQQRAEVRETDVAGCLRTARGGSSRQIVIAAGHGNLKMRHMTSREYARLQGVHDDYPINVDELVALTGFGDAVCVPLFAWIGEYVLNHLLRSEDIQRSSEIQPEQDYVQHPLFENTG
jgi:DNA (cytosine-5)-methyltransferase 1